MITKLVVFYLLVCFVSQAQTPINESAKPRNVTGQYRLRKDQSSNRLDVRQLADGKVKFQLVALWISPNHPDNIHNGEVRGIATLRNGLAVYEDGNCRVTMKFTSNRVTIITDDVVDDCGFGANVIASGVYRKIAGRKPKFDF